MHFRTWCRINDQNYTDKNITFVAHPTTLWGADPYSNFVFYETWHENPQATEIDREYQNLIQLKRHITPTEVKMEEGIWTAKFWKNTVERMIRSAAAAMISVASLNALGAIDIDNALAVVNAGGVAAIMSMLFALGGSQFGRDPSDPSVLK